MYIPCEGALAEAAGTIHPTCTNCWKRKWEKTSMFPFGAGTRSAYKVWLNKPRNPNFWSKSSRWFNARLVLNPKRNTTTSFCKWLCMSKMKPQSIHHLNQSVNVKRCMFVDNRQPKSTTQTSIPAAPQSDHHPPSLDSQNSHWQHRKSRRTRAWSQSKKCLL